MATKNASKASKKARKPDNVVVNAPREIHDKMGREFVQHPSTYTFASGRRLSVSAVLRCLGYYCRATGAQGYEWCQGVGLTGTAKGTCQQQCGSGRRTDKSKAKGEKGQPRQYEGDSKPWHGNVPQLSAEEVKELQRTFDAHCTPAASEEE